ncbi:MAG: adenosine deaminase, partial [Mesorhizobium sp.]
MVEADEVVGNCETAGIPLRRPRESLFEAHDLKSFLEMLDWICGTFRTPDQLAHTVYRLSQRLAKSGVRYADVIVNPTHW